MPAQVEQDQDIVQTRHTPQRAEKLETEWFVPHWTMNDRINALSSRRIHYFGISPARDGTIRDDNGWRRMDEFIGYTQGMSRSLVITMLDDEVNTAFLRDSSLRERFILLLDAVLAGGEWDMIVLDFEYRALPFSGVSEDINQWSEQLSTAARNHGMQFGMLIYGDTFYRVRPYDIQFLSTLSDRMYIMAYDFYKTNDTAGPQFPISAKDYDFQQMLRDMTGVIPHEKLTIIHGLFSYLWRKDQGRGEAITLNQAEGRLFPDCRENACIVRRDLDTHALHITYTDRDSTEVEVWVEDIDTIAKKNELLRAEGMSAVGYWAYGYGMISR
jgi:hypothetical protein